MINCPMCKTAPALDMFIYKSIETIATGKTVIQKIEKFICEQPTCAAKRFDLFY